jgi:hypothetical protein
MIIDGKDTKNKIIQGKNLAKIEIFQGNNLPKIEKIQGKKLKGCILINLVAEIRIV